MTFAEKLMELRRQRGWSQEELGDKLGVTRQTVSKWETGQTTPEMEKLAAMSDLFSITTDELIKGNTGSTPLSAEKPQEDIPLSKLLHFEYKSRRTWHGLPVVHINVGLGRYSAKGVFAFGNAARGIFAIGLAAMGVVSLGLASLGVLALGTLAAGIIAYGSAAVGVIAFGGLAAGVIAFGGASAGWIAVGGGAAGVYAIGGSASASQIAMGGVANGVIAIGDNVQGEICISAPISAEEVLEIIQQRLPSTPSWVADIFANLANSLSLSADKAIGV